jgi:uncharacterized protein YwbE
MLRVKYVKRSDGKKVSMRVFTDKDGTQLKLLINEDNKSGSVITAIGEIPILSYSASSPHKIKIKLRQALKKLGVDIGVEKRDTPVEVKVKRVLRRLGIDPNEVYKDE